MLVWVNWFAADAVMKPVWPLVWSVITSRNACRPEPSAASNKWTEIRSPELINRVLRFGVKVRRFICCGFGGPVGLPSSWTNAKFSGSTQLLFSTPPPVASNSNVNNAAHQCVLSQLPASTIGAKPGG